MRTNLASAVMIGLVLSACSSDSGTGLANPDLNGAWQISGMFSNASVAISCNATGTASITQTGNTFSGSIVQQGTCSTPAGVVNNSGTGAITGGQINGNNVSFQTAGCSYTGTSSGIPVNRMTGTSSCTIAVLGQNLPFTGTWQASR